MCVPLIDFHLDLRVRRHTDIPRLVEVPGYAGLVLLAGLAGGASRFQDGLRSLVVYVSIALIAWAASRLFRHLPARLFLAGVGIWLLVTVLQMLIDPYFLTRLLPRAYDFGFVGRGYMSLAPEPSYFVRTMVAFLVLNEFFFKDRRYGKYVYLGTVAAIVSQVVVAKAGVSVVYLGVAAAAKAVSIGWEKGGREKTVAGTAALLLAAGLAAFFVVPGIRDSRGGAYLTRIESAISNPAGHEAARPAGPPEAHRGRMAARYNPLPKTEEPKSGPSLPERVLEKLYSVYPRPEHIHPARQPDLEPLWRVDRNERGRLRDGNGPMGGGSPLDAQIRRR